MTLGAIIWCSIVTLVIFGVGAYGIQYVRHNGDRTYDWETQKYVAEKVTWKIVAIVLACALLIGAEWVGHYLWYRNTASGQRAVKTQRSNFSNGIEREVKVYDVNGEIVAWYEGKFDITYDDDRILFDDEEGKRHIIYYPTGTVTIDEIGGEE